MLPETFHFCADMLTLIRFLKICGGGGGTGRALRTGKKEHHTSVRNVATDKSALVEHVIENNHRVAWDDTKRK